LSELKHTSVSNYDHNLRKNQSVAIEMHCSFEKGQANICWAEQKSFVVENEKKFLISAIEHQDTARLTKMNLIASCFARKSISRQRRILVQQTLQQKAYR